MNKKNNKVHFVIVWPNYVSNSHRMHLDFFQWFNRNLVGCFSFTAFAMKPFQFFRNWCVNLDVLYQKFFDVYRCLHPTNLIVFSLNTTVAKSVRLMILTDGKIPFLLNLKSLNFDMRMGIKLDIAINYVCFWIIFVASTLKQA